MSTLDEIKSSYARLMKITKLKMKILALFFISYSFLMLILTPLIRVDLIVLILIVTIGIMILSIFTWKWDVLYIPDFKHLKDIINLYIDNQLQIREIRSKEQTIKSQEEYQNLVIYSKIVFKIHKIFKSIFSDYNIKISPNLLEGFHEKINYSKKFLTEDIKLSYFSHLSNSLGLNYRCLMYLYSQYIENYTFPSGIIINNARVLDNYIYILKKNKKLNLYDIDSKTIMRIIRYRGGLNIENLTSDLNLINKINPLIDEINEYIKEFNFNFRRKSKTTIFLLKLFKESFSRKNFFDVYSLVKIIINNEIFLNFEQKRFHSRELKVLRNLFLYYLFRDHFSAFFKKFCRQFVKYRFSLKILWTILNENLDIKSSLKEFKSDFSKFKKEINLLKESNTDTNFINIFKEELKEGRVIINKKELYRIYVNQVESKMGMLDRIFSSYGRIDYKIIFQKIFINGISQNTLLKIISTQSRFRPYLLTFGQGGAKYINEILKSETPKDKFFADQYTNTARIGIIPEEYKSLEEFKVIFEKKFHEEYFNSQNKRFEKFSNEFIRSKNDVRFKELPEKIRERITFLRGKISELFKNRLEYRDYVYELQDIYSEFELKRFMPDLDKLLPNFDILFHEISHSEEGFAIIEHKGKFKTFEIIKKQLSDKLGTKKLSAGLLLGDLNVKNHATNLQKIIIEYLKNSSFLELISTESSEFFKFSDIPDKINNKKTEILLKYLFGDKSTKKFLHSIHKKCENLDDFGEFIKNNLEIKTGLRPELYKENLTELQRYYGKYSTMLVNFWNERLQEYLHTHDIEEETEEEYQILIDKFPDLSMNLLEIVLYFSLVVKWELDNYDFPRASSDLKKYYKIIRDNQNIKYLRRAENELHFKRLLEECISYSEKQKRAPLYIKPKFKDLAEEEKERIFQADMENFFTYKLGTENVNPEPRKGGNIDFIIYGYPFECKVRKRESSQTEKKFLNDHIEQISAYCGQINKFLGFLVYYDNVTPKKAESAIISEYIKLREGILNISDEKKVPIIVTVRIPNYAKRPSGRERF